MANLSMTVPLEMAPSFGAMDYVMFVGMMLFSTLIGTYYGLFKKQDTVSDYLLGGQKMGIFPMAMSMISSSISGITMIGVPSDVYLFGTQYMLIAFTVFPSAIIIINWIQPMFYKLQFTSSFEYLEHRFSRPVRQMASFLYSLGCLLYLPVVVYVPCLALNQVSGISVHIISPIACLVCVFYTSIGGLRAVVWTDAFQLLMLFLASIVVIVLGVINVGGLGTVWERASEGGRLVLFDMDPSPYARCTFWNMLVGSVFMQLDQHGVQPSSVQRSLCLPTLAKARHVVLAVAVGFFFTTTLSILTGLVIYAYYYTCDPLHRAVGLVAKQDQLVPYFVMDVGSKWPGLSGLFVAGVFSAALSSMSAFLNALSGTLYKDFIERMLPARYRSDAQASRLMKIIALAIGGFCVIMILLVENLGGVLQVTFTLAGITSGTAFGLFALGMFVPCANKKGALYGALCSLLFMAVMVGGNAYVRATKQLYYPTMPTKIDGCAANSSTAALADRLARSISPDPRFRMPHDAPVFPLFKISFLYFSFIGVALTVSIGMLVTLCTGPLKLKDLDPDLYSPAVQRFLPRHRERLRKEKDAATEAPMQEYAAVSTCD